jgi:hypothetical protein
MIDRHRHLDRLEKYALRRQRQRRLERSFRRAWREMLAGQTRPISELWDELDNAPSSPVGANGRDGEVIDG